MTDTTPFTEAALATLAWKLRSSPRWMREEIIRQFCVPPDVKQALAELAAEALANVDQKLVDLIDRTIEPVDD